MRRYGTGAAQALLIHCTLGHGAGWAGLMTHLGDRMSAFAPDQPGHGMAPPCAVGHDFHDCATDRLRGLLREETAPPVNLVGHSYGATLALRLAMEHPDRVRRLVLIEPVMFAAIRGTPAWKTHDSAFATVRDALRRGDWETGLRRFLADWGDGTDWDDLARSQRDRLLRSGGPLLHATFPAVEEDSAGLLRQGRLERLAMPVLLVRGTLSPPVVVAIHGALRARIPVVSEVCITGARHMLPVTHAATLAPVLSEFLGL